MDKLIPRRPRVRRYDPNTNTYGAYIDGDDDDDRTVYLDDDNGSRPAAKPADPPTRELPRPPRPIPASLYDQLIDVDELAGYNDQALGELVANRAVTLADTPAKQAALNKAAAAIRARQEEFQAMSTRDQIDAWHQLLTHFEGAARKRDGSFDVGALEQQSYAAAGLGSLDISQHPETRLWARDLRSEYEAEQAEKNRQRGNQ
jgi:hypothetical protein